MKVWRQVNNIRVELGGGAPFPDDAVDIAGFVNGHDSPEHQEIDIAVGGNAPFEAHRCADPADVHKHKGIGKK